MTIKDMEQQVGMTKANIRFYEKEGLLSPGRGENNYREYTEQDGEVLRKIKILRTLGIPVPDIRSFRKGEKSMSQLMSRRAEEIETERKELDIIREICMDMREAELDFDMLDSSLLLSQIERLENRGGEFMKMDKTNGWKRLEPYVWMYCKLCLVSIIILPVNSFLNIQIPENLLNVWMLVVLTSPFLFYLVHGLAGGGVSEFLAEGTAGYKDTGVWEERIMKMNLLCQMSLIFIPLNRMFHIQMPLWLMVVWVALVFGSTMAVAVIKNR